ncbi:MAG TPA: nuclear transport factor 2 family protein [Parvularculaceae bacterium]|nr:nuclear transport factor 2 family protein [Parvularculaceae bacterium]
MAIAAQLTRDLFDALHRRDVAAAAALIAEDAVWRFPGRRGALAGDHVGREAIFAFFMKVAGLTQGSFHAERIEIVGDDRVAFFHFIGRAERDGARLENDTCLRLEFSDGRLVAAQEWVWDLDHVDAFWG